MLSRSWVGMDQAEPPGLGMFDSEACQGHGE